MFNLEKYNIPLENYGKSLARSHRQFLTKADHRGLSNPTQTRKDIMENLRNSMKQIHEVLKFTKNLKEDEIYNIFNSMNLASFLKSLIRDYDENPHRYGADKRKYDFRTSELARLMFELSSEYLVNSPIYSEMTQINENVKTLSDNYKVLSKAMYYKELEHYEYTDDQRVKLEENDKEHEKISIMQNKLGMELQHDGINGVALVSWTSGSTNLIQSEFDKIDRDRFEILIELNEMRNRVDLKNKKESGLRKKIEAAQQMLDKYAELKDKLLEYVQLTIKIGEIEEKRDKIKLFKPEYFSPEASIKDDSTYQIGLFDLLIRNNSKKLLDRSY